MLREPTSWSFALPGNLESIWRDTYANRLRWAEAGVHDFYEECETEAVRELYRRREHGEVIVTVYGPSQVGKTSLILKLMGVAQDCDVQLSQILRSSRLEQGCKFGPDTATAMIWVRSGDPTHFSYKESDQEVRGLDDDQIKKRLIDLRRRVVEHRFTATDRIRVGIPERFFDSTNCSHLRVNVVDLPGIGSVETAERPHVERLVQTYLPIANLILLLNRADKVNDFSILELPQLKDWRYWPEKFRIVLTHSVSPKSVKDELRNQTSINRASFLAIHRDSFFQDNPITNADDRSKVVIYPLEYGLSWIELRNHDAQLWDAVEPVVRELTKELISDIHDSANIRSSIMSHARMHMVIGRIREEKLREFDNDIANLKTQWDAATTEQTTQEEEKNKYEGEIEKLKRTKIDGGAVRKYKPDGFWYEGERRLSSIKGWAWEQFNNVNIWANNYVVEIRNSHGIRLPDGFPENHQREKWWNEYAEKFLNHEVFKPLNPLQVFGLFPADKLGPSYEGIRDWAIECCEKYSRKIADALNGKVSDAIKIHNGTIEGKIREKTASTAALASSIGDLEKIVAELAGQIGNLQAKRQQYSEKTERDIERARKLMLYLRNRFRQESQDLIQSINNPERTAEEKVLNLLGMYLIAKEMESMENLHL